MKNLFHLPALVVGFALITDCLHAATFTVTTTNISGPGSLPVAITQANATPGKNQINISVTNTITLGVGLPTVTNSVAITGVATAPTVISGGGTLSLFTFAAGATNSLSNLVLVNGRTTGSGAAISNSSTLSVSSCLITNHSALNGFGGAIFNRGIMAIYTSVISGNQAGTGGAIYNSGTMTLNNSLMSGNKATNGGAIFNGGSLAISILTISNNLAVAGYESSFGGGIYNTGVLTVAKSTFAVNRVNGATNSGGGSVGGLGFGGAIFVSSGTAAITNTTFVQNAAIGGNGGMFGSDGRGGAVYVQNYGYCILVNCTLANNLSQGGTGASAQGYGNGGGIYNYPAVNPGTVSLLNTIVAGNSAYSSPDLGGPFVSSGVNLIGNNQGATGLSVFDFQNVSASLGTLQNNGGTTLTCAPLPGSFAIGYGTGTGAPTTDQRGVPRPQGGAFDIGAVQVVTNAPYITSGAMVSGSGFNLNTIFDATNSYQIQASTNLTTWVSLITNSSGGILNYTDTAATNLNRRFYRAVKP